MILAAIIFVFAIIVWGLGMYWASQTDDETPHPPKCDCMTCGRKAAEKRLQDQVGRGW
jgi:hypothetical protein